MNLYSHAVFVFSHHINYLITDCKFDYSCVVYNNPSFNTGIEKNVPRGYSIVPCFTPALRVT